MSTVFQALADPTRLRIIGLLAAGEICVCHIHESLGVPQPTASRHLAYLRRAGLVRARRDGLWVHYSLATQHDPVIQTLVDAAAHGVGHLPTTARDRRRLGGRATTLPAAPAAPCCETFR
jgi:ArsR family transcriptional regulator, arsenate/arsenite/antimonite-responsive transcriptional repressor